jgi:hypothetical protein
MTVTLTRVGRVAFILFSFILIPGLTCKKYLLRLTGRGEPTYQLWVSFGGVFVGNVIGIARGCVIRRGCQMVLKVAMR